MQESGGLEEERRLCYVAITRAKELLYLTNAKRRMLFGNTTVNVPSRFITEIDPDLIDKIGVVEDKLKTFNKDKMYTNENIIYKPGEVVHHLSFGRGVVTSSDERFVTVAFNKNFGIKKFLSNYQGLRKEEKK